MNWQNFKFSQRTCTIEPIYSARFSSSYQKLTHKTDLRVGGMNKQHDLSMNFDFLTVFEMR